MEKAFSLFKRPWLQEKFCLVMCPGDDIFCQCFTTGRMFLVDVKSSVLRTLSKIFASTHLAPGTLHSEFLIFSFWKESHSEGSFRLTAFSVFIVWYASCYCWGLWNIICSLCPFFTPFRLLCFWLRRGSSGFVLLFPFCLVLCFY